MSAASPQPPDRPAAPRRADAHRNHQAVVEAAFEVLAVSPDASMQDIAEASGVGRTTVYRHFPSREALITALFEEVFDQSAAAIGAIVAEHDAPREVLRRIAEETVAIGDRYAFLAVHREIFTDLLQQQDRVDPLEPWLERQLAAGTLRPLGLTWIQGTITALVLAAHGEVLAGRETPVDAARKLASTLIAALVA